ncbi:hypothetical protein FNV43_RR02015 [Rhamnella rubrinervis]|uniref:F-box domain-containing protein n=1 Tax=Rhamnella rubrinervis TaxID=2594499 RepID=A0A8K0MTH0_9ROSA|nr:hypothetical protein FNV43_RR02015 [Rhamnella rubrinervis]
MAKRARCSTSSDFSTPNWAGLDPDLLGLILHKLVYIPDYISFNSACKPWNSLSSTHKEKQAWLDNKQQLPWLFLSSLNTDQSLLVVKLKLYNFTGEQMSDFQIPISSRNKCTAAVAVLLMVDVVNHGDESSKIKISEIAPDLTAEFFVDGYFVETTNGDLLMVYRYYNYSVNKSAYEVYRLIMDSNGNLESIPVANLGGESLIFVLGAT